MFRFSILFIVIFSILLFRNLDPFITNTIYAEDGVWLMKGINNGWFDTFTNARDDYFIFINIFVVYLSSLFSFIVSGNEYEYYHFFVAIFSNFYLSIVLLTTYLAFSRNFSKPISFAIVLLISLFPLGSHTNEIIGRSLQLGFYCTLLMANLVILKTHEAINDRAFKFSAFICLATNPLSIFPLGLYFLSSLKDKCSFISTVKSNFVFLVCCLFLFLVIFLRIYHSENIDRLSIEHIGNIIDFYFSRNLIYPFVYNVYSALSYPIFLSAGVIFLSFFFISIFRSTAQIRWMGILYFSTGVFLSWATWKMRPDIANFYYGYNNTFPERYFMAANIFSLCLIPFLFSFVRNESFKSLVTVLTLSVIALPWVTKESVFELNEPKFNLSYFGTFEEMTCSSSGNDVKIAPVGWSVNIDDVTLTKLKNSYQCISPPSSEATTVLMNDIQVIDDSIVLGEEDPFIVFSVEDAEDARFVLSLEYSECSKLGNVQVFYFDDGVAREKNSLRKLVRSQHQFIDFSTISPSVLPSSFNIRVDFENFKGCKSFREPKIYTYN